ncbi:MAG: phosphate ABC transporter permease subunit PstC [Planctomycetota bacterium]|nr:MAG: phosphate ABC transporter permease subunit PstC [Planctomycetota bacterium]REJ92292.1 MAG: phosphate ABC transporter permease subunit PstC [Planctomycetota bacterium]REK24698.1 MAG: phosphate ABC transporter permease subunit PstC [Planctomycetota bacterium]REK40197.1 MAG: phosphate ABC transporter permease subunit PstC [Planctomycetota bacterium]
MLDGLDLNQTPIFLWVATALLAALLGGVAYQLSHRKTLALVQQGHRLRATPDYYGWHTVVLMFLPVVLVSVATAALEMFGVIEVPNLLQLAACLAIPALILWPALRLVHADLNARALCERVIYAGLLGAALVSIFTTLGIVLSVVFEAIRFFQHVSLIEFLTGTTWAPGGAFLESAGRGAEQGTEAEFGSIPLFAGTLMITAVAMLVAVPLGLCAAIYTAEYASKRVRSTVKPMLELLAGIPTVVYGFFAAITVAPFIVAVGDQIGLETSFENALAPGVIMGVMIIPFMSSLCDDVITSVPQNLRQAAMSLGSTKSEMIKGVVLPAALPGIVSAFLLSVSRAVGETMIVVMAAGMAANLTTNPLEQMTTVTVHIVANLTGDLAYDNPQTLSAFGLGLSLLIVTLLLNIISVIVIRKFRQRYEAD